MSGKSQSPARRRPRPLGACSAVGWRLGGVQAKAAAGGLEFDRPEINAEFVETRVSNRVPLVCSKVPV